MSASAEHGALCAAIALQEGVPSEWAEEVRGRSEGELRASAQALRRKLGLDHSGAGYPSPEAALTAMQRERAARNARMRWG
jgi:hypothetical protein